MANSTSVVLLSSKVSGVAAGQSFASEILPVLPEGITGPRRMEGAPAPTFIVASIASDQSGTLDYWFGFEEDLGTPPADPPDITKLVAGSFSYTPPGGVSFTIQNPVATSFRVKYTNGGTAAAFLRLYVAAFYYL